MKMIFAIVAACAALTSSAGGITICQATSAGQTCQVIATDQGPMCLDGNMRVVPCSSLQRVRCSLTFGWDLGDHDHPTVTEITRDGDASNAGACADEADVAASQITTRIIKLKKGETP